MAIKQVTKQIRWILEFAALWPVLALLQSLPEPLAFAWGRAWGVVAYWFCVNERRWCHRNLELVYGHNLEPSQRRKLAVTAFKHLAVSIVEILRMNEQWIHDRCTIDGTQNYRDWRDKNPGRGIVAISGHVGNLEILGRFAKEIDVEITMVSRPLENPYFERTLRACRSRYGLNTVPRGALSIRDTLRQLKAGKSIGIAIDLNTAVGGVFVDVFGISAATARGAAAVAISQNAGVFVVHTFRQLDGSHRVVISRPIEVTRTGDLETDVVVNTQRFSRAVEQCILEHPDQYHWQHPRFRSRPDGSTWSLKDSLEVMMTARRSPPVRPPARFRRQSTVGATLPTA